MKIQLIEGSFNANDSLDIITQMIHVKIKFHENKISNSSSEEDSKSRESKIKQLQKDLYDIRKYISTKGNVIELYSSIEL
jgi:hypothetical protein